MSDERATTSAASEEEGVQFDQLMRAPQAVNGSSAQHEEREFYYLVKDTIMSIQSEDTILTKPNVPGNDLSDKITIITTPPLISYKEFRKVRSF